FDRDDVARHKLPGGNLRQLPTAEDPRLDDHHLLERDDRLRGLPLLAEAEHGVEKRQEDDDEPGSELMHRPDAAETGNQQDDLHRIAVLTDERVPPRLTLRLPQPIPAPLLATLR